jgi:hypothetical protein
MIGTSIVAAMETSFLTLQATKVVVMPLLALIEGGKAAQPDLLSCDDLRAIIRTQKCHAGAIE